MKKVKFDFDATKQNIFVNQNAAVPVGAPVDQIGAVANNGNAIGIVIGAKKQVISGRFVKNLVVMVAGYCDIIDAQEIWGDEYSAEAIAAMSDIVFCDNHKIPGGSDPVLANAKSTGGIGWTEQGEQTVLFDGIAHTEMDRFIAYGEIDKFEIVVGQTYSVAFDNEIFGGVIAHLGDNDVVVLGDEELSEYPFRIEYSVDNDTNILCTQNGGDFQLKVIGGTLETVHKIDEKYLPASGGAMVVNFTAGAGGFTADKTPQEIVSAFSSGTFVYAVLMGAQSLTLNAAYVEDDEYFNIKFDSIAFASGAGLIVTHLEWDDDDAAWKYSQAVLPID